jgi:uncharacterized protein YkwD
LRSASPWLGLAIVPNIAEAISTQNSALSEGQLKELQASLLTMINEERSLAQVPVLAMDDLASRVAAGHALDMAKGKFASHWGSDGRKPYQRYSLAGGTHATEENVSAANNTWSLKPADIAQDVAYLHVRLYSETPPHDGHRRTILAPQQTHVGLGIAIAELRLRVVELFVAKHVEVEHIDQRAKPGATIKLAGRLLNPAYTLASIEVFYEVPPKPPELGWLQTARPYSLPDESVTLRPRLPTSMMYRDGSRGIIDSDGTYFQTPITLFKATPGIYTIACWLRRINTEKPFIATLICIQAE